MIWDKNIFEQDESEIRRYNDAVTESKGQIRSVELHTNHAPSVAYRQVLMAAHHTSGRVVLTP